MHGFALLVSLGDARRAERATGDALAVGSQHAAALSHPERAAAWLRARVFRRLRHASLFPGSPSSSARRAELAKLGVDDATFDGLASLSLAGRVAVAATMIERFAAMDVETILGTSSSAARRLAARASSDFLAAVASRHVSSEAGPAGELAQRVSDVADRAIASAPGPRAP